MNRRLRPAAHSAGPRFAALSAVTVLGSLLLVGLPGTASATSTPSPDPLAAVPTLSTSTIDPAATPTPTDTTVPTATPTPEPTTASPTPVATTASPAPLPRVGTITTNPGIAPRTSMSIQAYPAGTAGTSPHGPYTTTSDECAVCHRAHTAKSNALLTTAAPQATLCFTCHDGTGALSDIKAYYTDLAVPANDASTSSYYRHDSLIGSSHVLAETNEFGGVSNRHAECSDCHNPHRSGLVSSTSSPAGTPWTASSRLAGVSGVSVVNGGVGSTPTYTWLDGTTTAITYEYQLCFKCHSGFTTLPTNGSGKPSRDVTDVAKEFNPANNSMHPVEAAGKNTTTKMGLSLAGGTRWQFTTADTVRCTQCHATSTVPIGAAKGDSLAPHTSQYRGILLANYQDRTLMSLNEPYDPNHFALCWLCHSQTPFTVDTTSPAASAFAYHYKHVRNINGKGSNSSTDIDTDGAGQGNAICSECHFRTHGTGQGSNNLRGVEFSPNIQPSGGVISYTHTASGGSCTLICHGVNHNPETYNSGTGG